jgi:hypothetical protein
MLAGGHIVARGVCRSRWANPFKIGRDGSREEVVAMYEPWFLSQPDLVASLPELGTGRPRSRMLVCARSLSRRRADATGIG